MKSGLCCYLLCTLMYLFKKKKLILGLAWRAKGLIGCDSCLVLAINWYVTLRFELIMSSWDETLVVFTNCTGFSKMDWIYFLPSYPICMPSHQTLRSCSSHFKDIKGSWKRCIIYVVQPKNVVLTYCHSRVDCGSTVVWLILLYYRRNVHKLIFLVHAGQWNEHLQQHVLFCVG